MFKKGNVPWNYSPLNIVTVICGYCSKVFKTKRRDKKTAKYCSNSCCSKKRFSIPENTPMFGKKMSIKSRKLMSIAKKGKYIGSNHPNWKGGRWLTKEGYIYTMAKNHPFTRKGYVLKHRLVMEKHISRFLKPKEVVHHINNNPSDNRIENLMLFPNIHAHRNHHVKLGST